jgi:hypothetical protein
MSMDPSDYRVRRLLPEDAQAIPALTEKVNGPGYVHPEVYHPEVLLRMNQSGERVSIVALHDDAGVVGHYALERPDLGRFAESGEAMVLPEHQHHHLLDRMRVLLEQEANRIELVGIYGNAVTHHVFSQRMEELFKAVPTGFSLGSSPASAHRLDNFPQRVSLVTYFKYMRHPGAMKIHLPERHQAIAARIFAALGRDVKFEPLPDHVSDTVTIESSYDPDEQQASIIIRRGGSQGAGELRETVARMLTQPGVEVLFAEVPLSEPGAIEFCDALEDAGFFFCGIEPRDEAEGDLLHLQMLLRPLDLSLVQTVDELARDVLAYIGTQREILATRARR